MNDGTIINQIIGTGVAGVMLFLVVAPMFKWMQAQIGKKDEEIQGLITTHYKNDNETKTVLNKSMENLNGTMTQLQKTIDLLPDATAKLVEKQSPKESLDKMTKAATDMTTAVKESNGSSK